MTVVPGCRLAVASVTYQPVMALRAWVPESPLPAMLSVTVPLGFLRAVAGVTNRPDLTLRALLLMATSPLSTQACLEPFG